MSSGPTDEARWRDTKQPMTLEQRAEYIACARSIRGVIGGTIHNKVRDRALEQLREVDALARPKPPSADAKSMAFSFIGMIENCATDPALLADVIAGYIDAFADREAPK